MLVVNRANGKICSQLFTNFIDYCQPGDLLVLNNTKVIPARLFGQKPTGGKIECLIERIQPEAPHQAWAHLKANRSLPVGGQFEINGLVVTVLERADGLFLLDFGETLVIEALQAHGHIPLPPYIARADEQADHERYQTVFAEHLGAVAAPTAGLHFNDATLNALRAKGVNIAHITLHVGAGTFQPVKSDVLEQHQLHAEWLDIPAATCQAWQATKQARNKVIAIGTTSVRALESAYAHNQLSAPFQGDTRLFIRPGYQFKTVDSLLTNFHLPKSTLLMLISAFADHSSIMTAYQQAIAERYRFYSYGDAMLIDGSA